MVDGLDPNEARGITMTKIGYARVSSTDQDTRIQVEALRAAGCDVIRQEKASGTTTEGRAELATVLDFLQRGDVLVVTRIDRLARSISDLLHIVTVIKGKGATIKATEQPFDTGDIYGELTFNLLGVFADFETKLRKERQMEGIAKAKADGVYKGRKATIDPERLRQMQSQGMGATEIAKAMGIGRASVYRVLGKQ
jgi:DNA invertase Pin-like site-specific DNA recombinase